MLKNTTEGKETARHILGKQHFAEVKYILANYFKLDDATIFPDENRQT